MKRLPVLLLLLLFGFTVCAGISVTAEAGGKTSGALMSGGNSGTHIKEGTITARDSDTGPATGKRQYAPLKFRKPWSKP